MSAGLQVRFGPWLWPQLLEFASAIGMPPEDLVNEAVHQWVAAGGPPLPPIAHGVAVPGASPEEVAVIQAVSWWTAKVIGYRSDFPA